jgi:hypothetical protein
MSSVSRWPSRRRHAGVILPMVAGAMLALLAVAALALDTSHAYLNKARLQNSLDAGALAGARVLATSKDDAAARTAAGEVFQRNAAAPGNGELLRALAVQGVEVIVETSNTLIPFAPGSDPPQYVRIRAEGLSFASWFAQVVGLAEKGLRGSAVAGPLPVGCPDNVTPIMVCGDPEQPDFGYERGSVITLKYSSSGSPDVGPGNFQLIRMGGEAGANVVRAGLAGDYEQVGCSVVNDEGMIETQPGNMVGPVQDGLNTRFGLYGGPMSNRREDFPPDTITRHAEYDPASPDSWNYRYSDYVADQEAGRFTEPDGVAGRREIAVAIADCSGNDTGQSQLALHGFGCFFLLDPVNRKGNDAEIYGEFVETCLVRGGAANPSEEHDLGQPQEVVLYKDPDSHDS